MAHMESSRSANVPKTVTDNGKAGGGSRPIRLCNWKNLMDLLQKEPNDLLLSLLCQNLGFLNLLARSDTNDNILSIIIRVIARACLSEHAPSALLEFLRQVSESCFFKQVFVQYLGNLVANEQTIDEGLTMESLFVFEILLKRLPSKSMPIVTLLLTQIKYAAMLASHSEEKQEAIRQIEEMMADNQKQIQMGHLMRDQEDAQDTFWDPTEKFRRLSVIPTSKDLSGQRDPRLSKNIIYGKYKNVSNYLDVQFRLLREDLIRPLREGLAELLESKKHRFNNRLRTNLKLYNKVHIISPNFSSHGLVYKINFDMKHLRKVVWERTKRLNFGSLVCLSSDEFKTILVATVAERDGIKHGEVHILFQNEESRQHIDLRPETSYEMIESPAYFEAYKHVLEGLQFLDEYSLPFIEYLLNQREKDEPVAPPGYLLTNTTPYDFTCIVKNSCALESAPLNFETWPTAEQLQLDLSQYNALKSALTTEFVLVQGPPGTGKTYIGLKIVQVLLANELAWNSINLWESRPILIVCFTNHALDQFLELILNGKLIEESSVDLIRIGSQSKSEKMQKHLIKEVKKKRHVLHDTIYSDIRHTAFDNKQQLQNKILPLAAYVELSKEYIFSESKLQRYMTANQMKSLLSRSTATESILFTWLMSNKAQANEIPEMIENANIEGDNEFEEDLDEEEDDDREDYKDNMNLTNKENFRATKSQILLAGDFLCEECGQPGDKIKQLRKLYVENQDIMNEMEAKKCVNVWGLATTVRWRLYNYWVSQHVEPNIQQLKDLLAEHEIQSDIVNEIGKEEDYRVMRSAKIIGMTTSGSARYRDVLQRVQPKIVIVEEAAEVLEAHIVTSLSKGCEHLILIGDHLQLRPNPTVYQLAKDYHLNISLFERMVLNKLHCELLTIQHRMRPEIVELIVPHIYKTLRNSDSVLLYENVWGILGNLFFLNHSLEEQCADDGQSHSNLHEAKFVSALCQYFIEVGYEPSQITVLTTYTGQMFLLRKHMPKTSFEGVRITPVDNYQGEENDIILLSLVRSNTSGNIGFLKIPNRVCVALSRAKKGCFIVGNGDQLANGCILWHDIIASLKKHNRFVDKLPLACHKHPENVVNVCNDSDFKLVPRGGCIFPCEYRLDCGHVCELKCHHFDPRHEKYKCEKNCTKSCSVGHPCKKLCYVECGDCQILIQEMCAALLHTNWRKCFEDSKGCTILIEKLLTRCGHMDMVPCHLPENEHRCQRACPKCCPNGHSCKKRCSENCGNCKVPVQKTLPKCEHTVSIPCFMLERKHKCNEPCKKVCPNGHSCGQLCHKPCGACTILVEKELSRCHHMEMVPCHRPQEQHKCESPCRTLCPSNHPCMKKCYEYCGDCTVLVEKILPKCNHAAVLPCSKSVSSYNCLKPCEKSCPIGHPCLKLCGEVCGLCKVEVDKILPQCKHIKRLACFIKYPEYEQCTLPCDKIIKCGHKCSKLCGVACTQLCQVVIPDILLPCLHRDSLPCSIDPKTHKCIKNVQVALCNNQHAKIVPCFKSSSFNIDAFECNTIVEITCNSVMKHKSEITCCEQTTGCSKLCYRVCNFEQSCGHRCQQKCRLCTAANKHESCTHHCTRKLPLCSHPCLMKCFETCPPCMFNCTQSCRHVKCKNFCSELCIPCREPCDWKCEHHMCRLTCCDPCTRPVCNEPCKEKLPCKHQCRGLCGEPCLDRCFTCSPRQVKLIENDLPQFPIKKKRDLFNFSLVAIFFQLNLWIIGSNGLPRIQHLLLNLFKNFFLSSVHLKHAEEKWNTVPDTTL